MPARGKKKVDASFKNPLLSLFYFGIVSRSKRTSICNINLGCSFPLSAGRGLCQPNNYSWNNKNLQLEPRPWLMQTIKPWEGVQKEEIALACQAQKSPCLCGCLLLPPCRSNPSKLIQLLTWNKNRKYGRKSLPEIAVIPSARGKSRQPAAYSPHVTACVRREESKQKPERKYHPVLLYRYRDLLSFGVNNAVNNITAGAAIAELHKTTNWDVFRMHLSLKFP